MGVALLMGCGVDHEVWHSPLFSAPACRKVDPGFVSRPGTLGGSSPSNSKAVKSQVILHLLQNKKLYVYIFVPCS
jgi:hypothetical protein